MIFSVKVHPRSREVSILWKKGAVHAYLTEPAEKNRANKQLVRELAGIFGSCRILRGAGSRSKMVELPVKSEKEIKSFLSNY